MKTKFNLFEWAPRPKRVFDAPLCGIFRSVFRFNFACLPAALHA